MKGLLADIFKACFWLLLIAVMVLLSTSGFSEFIYRAF